MSDVIVRCVVPTHDRDELLIRALDSVLAQGVEGVEVVVVDDLGRQETRATVAEWSAKSRLPVDYRVRADEGPRTAGGSRNCGAAGAEVEFLAFLDDDDWWEPDFLQEVLGAIRRGAADMAIAWTAQVRGDRRERGLQVVEDLEARDVVGQNPGLTGSNFLIRRSAFEAIGGFDSQLTVANDLDFLVRFLDAGFHYAVVARELVNQVGHTGGQLTTPSERRALGLEAYLRKYRGRMTGRDRRRMRRVIHSVRRVSAPHSYQRVGHLIGQALNSSPLEFMVSLRRALTGRRSVYLVDASSVPSKMGDG